MNDVVHTASYTRDMLHQGRLYCTSFSVHPDICCRSRLVILRWLFGCTLHL